MEIDNDHAVIQRSSARPRRVSSWRAVLIACVASYPHLCPASADERDQQAAMVRGVVKAVHTAALSTEIVTPIAQLGFREGEHFKSGDVLVELDCRRQRYEMESLAAGVREAKVAVASNDYLSERGAANVNDVAVAKARFDKATAELQALQAQISNCKLIAPFDGVVTELAINRFEVPTPNKPFMTIASDRHLEIEIVAPSRLITQLQAGRRLSFSVDETGRELAIAISRTGGAVDPVSQTLKIYATFADDAKDVLPGMSGAAHLDARGQ